MIRFLAVAQGPADHRPRRARHGRGVRARRPHLGAGLRPRHRHRHAGGDPRQRGGARAPTSARSACLMLEVDAIETATAQPGAVRRVVRRRRRRGRHAARPQRHGQDHHRALDHGHRAAEGRDRHVRRQGDRRPALVPRRAGRHRPRAGGAPGFPEPDRAREPGRHRSERGARADRGRSRRCSSCSRSSPQRQRQLRQPALGRRAADARHRPRADDQPEAPDPGRGDRGPRAADPAEIYRSDRAPQSRRPLDPGHRQGREGAHAGRRHATTCWRRGASSGAALRPSSPRPRTFSTSISASDGPRAS